MIIKFFFIITFWLLHKAIDFVIGIWDDNTVLRWIIHSGNLFFFCMLIMGLLTCVCAGRYATEREGMKRKNNKRLGPTYFFLFTTMVPSFPWTRCASINFSNGNSHTTSLLSTKNGSSLLRCLRARARGPAKQGREGSGKRERERQPLEKMMLFLVWNKNAMEKRKNKINDFSVTH